jgi:hypothetical protein
LSKPPALLAVVGKAILDKTGDAHAARREVAEAVIDALELVKRRCPACGATGYATAKISAVCVDCSNPMRPEK